MRNETQLIGVTVHAGWCCVPREGGKKENIGQEPRSQKGGGEKRGFYGREEILRVVYCIVWWDSERERQVVPATPRRVLKGPFCCFFFLLCALGFRGC